MSRYQKLLSRRAPQELRISKGLLESFESTRGENTKYILGAMREVDAKYTSKLLAEGNRVQSQLKNRLSGQYPDIDFERQGSVTNNTHLKYYSDIDVLVIIDKFVYLQSPLTPTIQYNGDTAEEILLLRKICYQELLKVFYGCEINNTGSFSISMTGGSLICKVDIVPSSWYDTVEYNRFQEKYLRGIIVIDKINKEETANFPFKFNFLLNQRDKDTIGITKMLIRFLKSLKADEEEDGKSFDLSSYDICSIVYRIPNEFFAYAEIEKPLTLITSLYNWLSRLIISVPITDTLKVIDDSRLIFDKPSKIVDLAYLYRQIDQLKKEVMNESGYAFISKSHLEQ